MQRPAPDMRPLSSQIAFASDSANGAMARLSGGAPPAMPDTETTIDQLGARIAATIDHVKSVPEEDVDGSEENDFVLKTPSGDISFKGLAFLAGFALPNFLFHVTTGYAILRHSSVPRGKLDFHGRG
jgi:uncharacterized protein